MIGSDNITNWRKSSFSDTDCVELGATAAVLGVRDTKQAGLPAGERPELVVCATAGRAFIAFVK